MVSSTHATGPPSGLALIPALLRLVRFSHTVFALPFALAGALLAEHAVPSAMRLVWIAVAMVGARTMAMALNRVVDARIDALNPRTASREIPAGAVSSTQALILAGAGLLALLGAVSQLPPLTWYLWPVPVVLFALYPFAKRFTWACHLILGVTIGLAPLGAWIAVTGSFGLGGILLGLAVATWIAGFDVIYALLDIEFDRAHGVHSIPVAVGTDRALLIARLLHVATIALLLGAGAASGVGAWYLVGVAACALLLIYEHLTADPANMASLQRAFGITNMVLAVVFAAAVVIDVVVG